MIKQQVQYLAMWTKILNSQPSFIRDKIYEAHKESPQMMVINMQVRKELQGIFDK